MPQEGRVHLHVGCPAGGWQEGALSPPREVGAEKLPRGALLMPRSKNILLFSQTAPSCLQFGHIIT